MKESRLEITVLLARLSELLATTGGAKALLVRG